MSREREREREGCPEPAPGERGQHHTRTDWHQGACRAGQLEEGHTAPRQVGGGASLGLGLGYLEARLGQYGPLHSGLSVVAEPESPLEERVERPGGVHSPQHP